MFVEFFAHQFGRALGDFPALYRLHSLAPDQLEAGAPCSEIVGEGVYTRPVAGKAGIQRAERTVHSGEVFGFGPGEERRGFLLEKS